MDSSLSLARGLIGLDVLSTRKSKLVSKHARNSLDQFHKKFADSNASACDSTAACSALAWRCLDVVGPVGQPPWTPEVGRTAGHTHRSPLILLKALLDTTNQRSLCQKV